MSEIWLRGAELDKMPTSKRIAMMELARERKMEHPDRDFSLMCEYMRVKKRRVAKHVAKILEMRREV